MLFDSINTIQLFSNIIGIILKSSIFMAINNFLKCMAFDTEQTQQYDLRYLNKI